MNGPPAHDHAPPAQAAASRWRGGLRAAVAMPGRAFRWVGAVAAGTFRHSVRDDITGVASQFAYNAFLATVPFLFVLVSLIGLVAEPDTFDRFLAPDAENAIPPELRDVLRGALLQATANSGEAIAFLALGLIGALYVSANVMGALVGGLDRARGVPHRRWVRGKVVAAALALGTSFLVVATTLALVGGDRLVDGLAQEIFGTGAPNAVNDVLYLIGAGSLLVFTLVTFHIGPNAPRRRLIADVPGAVISVILWLGVSRLFALYIENFDSYRTVYGALAGAAIYLIFLFLTCVSLLIGAEVNEQMARMRIQKRERQRARDAERIAAERAAAQAGADGTSTPTVTLVHPPGGEPPTQVVDAEEARRRLRGARGE